ncbi:glucan endo-1,3-beta-glucosidase 7 [Silene latifolia]|uniref:glucan endo-1,3-beta-glucosidase 7 n=1 Tax=Silene latifolia TaxID=37657 RepID=UPI003D7733F3
MSSSLQFFILFLALTVLSSESAEILTIHDSTFQKPSSIAVSVSNQELHEVANSVLLAETWLRNYVLAYYPASNITHIVVAHNLLCSSHKTHDHFNQNLILHSLKNLHYSLTRWGLQSEIKVSASFSSHCLLSHHLSRSHSLIKSVFHFINSTNSSYLINPHHEINPKFESLVQTHMNFIEKFGFLTIGDIKFVQNNEHESIKSSTMRKLSYVLPTAEGPLPPLIGVGPGPITTPPSPPQVVGQTPTYLPHPHHNHHHHNLPPCNPWAGPAGPVESAPPPQHASPSPVSGLEKLWCVAKPSVPAETLQEAMDYACGEGGAECDEIQPNGSCYYPDTVVAHASYAFNSYWQKNKMSAGSCSFGGTAIIINSDPSFQQCRFTVS